MLETRRLRAVDVVAAKSMFATMASVFEEPAAELTDAYVADLLNRAHFWAIAAIADGEVVGGLTAHTLPMTRAAENEVFLFDIAVKAERQREGVGRALVARLREEAAAEGTHVMFVAADEEDVHALDFYRALGGEGARATFFTFGSP